MPQLNQPIVLCGQGQNCRLTRFQHRIAMKLKNSNPQCIPFNCLTWDPIHILEPGRLEFQGWIGVGSRQPSRVSFIGALLNVYCLV